VARVLIVGCGCRGRSLAGALIADGHAVRGSTRDPARATDIEASGAEAVIADPDRLGTLMAAIAGVSAICWLMGSAGAAINGERLETLTERLVDTHVRGLVYEAAGPAGPEVLGSGEEIVRRAAATWHMQVEVVKDDPSDHDVWLASMRAAVGRIL
jgi:nucleoside-diphosphate-sugar epimerase